MRALLLFIVASVICAVASAQNFPDIRDNDVSYHHLGSVRDTFIIGYPDGNRRWAPMSKAEFAVATYQMLQIIEYPFTEKARSSAVEISDSIGARTAIAENFWHIEFLMRRFRLELHGIGVTDDEMWGRLERAKKGYADLGVELLDPYSERFTDVPEGHWADEAIHNLRRAGILYGYPDGAFRG